MPKLALAFALVLSCSSALTVAAQSILGVQGWTGTIRSRALQSGTGTSNIAGFTIAENWTHDSDANFTVTLAKDPSNARRWTGTVTGAVTINNKNIMTMTAPAGILTCTGTLFWIGTAGSFSGRITMEADAAGTAYRMWLTPNTIPAPNSGSVVCPFTGAQFPTVDPNSPFIPNIEPDNSYFPVSGTGTTLTGGRPYLGDSGIGGFVASPARVTYDVTWNLRATGITPVPVDPILDPDCRQSGSIIGCLDQTLGESLPLAGSPFSLRYQSNRTEGYAGSTWQASTLGLGGWWLDAIQVYLPATRTLLAGDGTSTVLAQNRTPEASGTGFVSNAANTRRYFFNSAGRHLRTVDSLTNTLVLSIEYDAQGRVTKLTDAEGGVTTVERSGSTGRATAIVTPGGHRTALQTDSAGYLSQVAGPSGETYALRHDSKGLLTEFTNPLGATWKLRYDSNGRLLSDAGPDEQTTSLTRQNSGQGFAVTVERSGNLTTRYETSPASQGKALTTTQPGGHTRTLQYASRESSAVYEDGMRADFSSASNGSQVPPGAEATPADIAIVTPSGLAWTAQWSDQTSAAGTTSVETFVVNGQVTTATSNTQERTFEVASPEGRISKYQWNTQGAITNLSSFWGPRLELEYGANKAGKPVAIHHKAEGAEDRVTALEWNRAGLVSSVTTPSGRTFGWTYDGSGRVESQELPGGRSVGFVYDRMGNVTSVTPPGKPAHGFEYSPVGRLLSRSVAGRTAAKFEYDAAGRLSTVLRPGSWSLDYRRDTAGRVIRENAGTNVEVNYAYDTSTGNLTKASGPSSDIELHFDWDGSLPLSVTTSMDGGSKDAGTTVSWTYDNFFRPATRKIGGSGELAFVHDADGLLTVAGAYRIDRDGLTGQAGSFLLDGASGWWSFNPYGEFTGSSVEVLGNEIYSSRYERDAAGRVTHKEEYVGGSATTWDYEYDAGGRLVAVKRNGSSFASYEWDANDNRTSITNADGVTVAAEVDSGDRMTKQGDATFQHLASGERSVREDATGRTTYAIDPWGNLTSVVTPRGRVEYKVDAMGHRIRRSIEGGATKAWVYEPFGRVAAELDPTGAVVSEFVYASADGPPVYMTREGKTYLLVADQAGSMRLAIDVTSGEIAHQIDYDPFGVVLRDTNPGFQPFGFGGGMYDPATGLVRIGARDYDPLTARWISEDPRPYTGGSNFYAYCGGDPVNLNDPTGTDAKSNIGNLPQTQQGKQISDSVNTAKKAVDGAKAVVEFSDNPLEYLKGKASEAIPEGAKAEYEKIVEDVNRSAEEVQKKFEKAKKLYEEAIRALCGGEEAATPGNTGRGSGSNGRSGGGTKGPKPLNPFGHVQQSRF